MKVIHFSTYDIEGGAGGAAYQMHRSFLDQGIESLMLVKFKKSNDKTVAAVSGTLGESKIFQSLKRNALTYFLFFEISSLLKKIYGRDIFLKFNKNQSDISFSSIEKYLGGADIICFHWIDGFLSTGHMKKIQNKTGAPILWILQDIEPLTGGCHYTDGCEGFRNSCGKCPQLGSNKENDASRMIWKQKQKDLQDINLTLVAPTSWVMDRIRESSLFKNNPVEKILLSVDTEIFRHGNQSAARKKWDLPAESKIIFFGAQSFSDKRKGMNIFLDALRFLKEDISTKKPDLLSSILLVSAGREKPNMKGYFKHRHIGWISNQKDMAAAFQSADIFACPSTEDAGPVMINQSIACGTPVVSFNMGVASDLITDRERGFVVENFNVEKFAESLYNLIIDPPKPIEFEHEQYECDPSVIANLYLNLFNRLLSKKLKK